MMKKFTYFILSFAVVLTFATQSIGQCLTQSFEGAATDTWAIVGGTQTVSSGSGPVPNTSHASDGSNAWVLNNSSETLELACVDISGLKGVTFSFDYAGFGSNTSNGIDGTDDIFVDISLDGGATFSVEAEIQGAGANNRWSHGDGTPITHGYLGGSPITNYLSTTDAGPSSITFTIPDCRENDNFCIRLRVDNNRITETWAIDNFVFNATNSCTPGDCAITNVVASSVTCNGNDAEFVITWDHEFTTCIFEVDIDNNGFVPMVSGGTYTIAGPTTATTGATVTVRDECDFNAPCMGTALVDIPECPVAAAPCDVANVVNGDIIITEIMYDPCDIPDDGEFVEICNTSTTTTYDISEWTVNDVAPGNVIGTFPTGTMLAPCECAFRTFNNQLRNNASEGVSISDCAGTILDIVEIGGADFQAGCWDNNAGLSLSLVDWKNQTTASNDLVTNYAPGTVAVPQPGLGGTPGAPNTFFACLDVSGTFTATCDLTDPANPMITFDVPYTFANSATPANPLILEAFDGTTLLTTSSVTTAAGSASFAIPGSATAQTLTITILPQGGTIDQTCFATAFTIDIPPCRSCEAECGPFPANPD